MLLNSTSGLGPRNYRKLLNWFGSASGIVQASPKALQSVPGLGPKLVESIEHAAQHFDIKKEQGLLTEYGVRFTRLGSSDYPSLLNEIPDSPIGLYLKGCSLVGRPSVAIVGSRRATLYGLRVAETFAKELGRMGFSIVSGMALGIDAAAHKACLSVGGHTVAVLGCGINIIYPSQHKELYQKIGQVGTLVSEFQFSRRADRHTFPMRNRLVSGLSQALIVVESDRNGGSMITARLAADQGRPVFAVPGRIDQPSSRGCHLLIREGASLITAVDDILEEIGGSLTHTQSDFMDESPQALPLKLSEIERDLLRTIATAQPITPEGIASLTGLPLYRVLPQLSAMEIKRCITKRPDGAFEPRLFLD